MLTTLCIKKSEQHGFLLSALSKLKPDKIGIDVRECGDIKVKCVTYTSNHKNINWGRLDKFIGAQRNHLLCSADVELPSQIGYKRFKSGELYVRLCTNLALCLIKSVPKGSDIPVVLCDNDANHTALCEHILKYTDRLSVKTNELDVYADIARDILEGTGAVLRFSKSTDLLTKAKIIIAPEKICEQVAVRDDALVLTTARPQVNLSGVVIYGYSLSLPEQYRELMPPCLDETYFASALYTVQRLYPLGSLIPRLCFNDSGAHTVKSLNNLIAKT